MLNRASTQPIAPAVTSIDTGRVNAQTRARFRAVVQSPLRAGILRFLYLHPHEEFDLESIMARFGCIRVDVENCVWELVNTGMAESEGGTTPLYRAVIPSDPILHRLLDDFVADTQGSSVEERSASVQRFRDMMGRDEKMMLIFESIRTVARTDLSVLILGPTGSGKDVVARIIHDLSSRQHETFQAVNCAAMPDSLFDSEVFGHERGAFDGAYEHRAGRIELANNGTLFLDDVGGLSATSQSKLLRVIEDRRVERPGSRMAVDIDFRLVCASDRPLETLVSEGVFREDLYYRINAFTVRLPALRERPSDIPVLAERFLGRHCGSRGLAQDARRLAPDALDLLQAYPWPGNIRELETTISRAAMAASDGYIHASDLHFLHSEISAPRTGPPGLLPMKDVEREHIRKVLGAVHWNKKRAAQILQISRETLYRKIADYSLSQNGGRS